MYHDRKRIHVRVQTRVQQPLPEIHRILQIQLHHRMVHERVVRHDVRPDIGLHHLPK